MLNSTFFVILFYKMNMKKKSILNGYDNNAHKKKLCLASRKGPGNSRSVHLSIFMCPLISNSRKYVY